MASLRKQIADVGFDILQRPGDFLLGIVALATGSFFLYFGVRGAIGRAGGTREAWTEPWVFMLGVLAGTWMLSMSVRILRGPSRYRTNLLSRAELLVLSLGAIAGAIWAFGYARDQAIYFLIIGLGGLGRWWMVRRDQ